jgi:hypothetical protein
MYHDIALKGITCPNEAEFRGYIILLNLNDANFLWYAFTSLILCEIEMYDILLYFGVVRWNN